jgi:UDP-glucose:(heptosyl)LPS alpha-1,3-glucosyltransferase
MNIAFAIVRIFPGGGLQRDCLAIASRLAKRGHTVTLFAESRRGELPGDIPIELLPNHAWTNHGRDMRFADDVLRRCSGRFDRLVGFGKLKGLDIVYCADPCIAARAPKTLARLTGRRRAMIKLESASFSPGAKTHCLLLSESQLREFREAWSTEPERLVLLPPTIDRTRREPGLRTNGARESIRAALNVRPDQWIWLAVATQPRVKGLDRAIEALKQFPAARLMIAGIAPDTRHGRSLKRWARHAGAADRIELLGVRHDIPQLMATADLLLHPARYDTTGTVILEALVNGLPVVTTDACGYATHVTAADAGLVIPEPFRQSALISALAAAESAEHRLTWSRNGVAYGERSDLYSGLDRAADLIAAAIPHRRAVVS